MARAGSIVAIFASTMCLGGFLLAQGASAQDSGLPPGPVCGDTRSMLVRFLDAKPVPGVRLTLTAAPPEMGGPELYLAGELAGPSTPDVPKGDEESEEVVVSPLPPTDTGCRPVVTGTLSMVTDPEGRARFHHLGEGTWILRFEGEVTRERRTAAIVPTSTQGLFPHGRTRDGGGFIERVDTLNEHGGPNPEPVPPVAGPTTSRYVLSFSPEHDAWLPGLDLAPDDDAPPAPLAAVTPVATYTDATPETSAVPPDADEHSSTNGAQESAFDGSDAQVVLEEGQPAVPPTMQDDNRVRWLNGWWVPVVALTLGGLLVIMWARRRTAPLHGGPRKER